MSLREKSVFVGNITYETTEDQLTPILAEVGPIVSFKLVRDRETGKHKGYGFCQYTDAATAQSAIRNLNGRKCNGRELRVNNASSDGTERSNNNENQSNAGSSSAASAQQRPNGMGPSHALAVKAALDQLSIYEIYEVVKSMKMLVDQRPDDAKKVLLENPSLALAILQAQMRLGMIQEDPTGGELTRKAQIPLQEQSHVNGAVPPPQGPPPPRGAPPNMQPPMMPTSQMMSGPPPPGYQYNNPRPPPNIMQPRPPMIMQPRGAPPPVLLPGQIHRPPQQQPQQPPPRPNMPSNIPPQLIQQALSLSEQQINSLAPAQRQALLQIRQQYGRQQQQGPPRGYF